MLQRLQQILRRLRRSPLFTLVTILTIAIGVGANTAIFSVIHGVLLKPLPYPEPDALVGLWQSAPNIGLKEVELSVSDYFIFREQNRSFSNMGTWNSGTVTLIGKDAPEQVRSLWVTDGTLPTLGIAPVRGRAFIARDTEPGSPDTVILTHAYWQHKFGGDPFAVGQRLVIDGKAKEIIGIMPAHFRFLEEKPDLILPQRFKRAETTLGNYSYRGIARLKPGVTLSQANADVARLIPVAHASFPAASAQKCSRMLTFRRHCTRSARTSSANSARCFGC
jgi:hypothetical protein